MIRTPRLHRWATYSDWDPEIELGGQTVHLTVATTNSEFRPLLEGVTVEAGVERTQGVVEATVPGPGFEIKAMISTGENGTGELLAVSYGRAGARIRLSWPIKSVVLV